MLKMILHVIILLAITALSQQCKYAKFSPQHSGCLKRNPQCKITDTSVSKSDRDFLVKLHNEYRSKVAQGKETSAGGMPPAADMMEMVWDDELASIAQKYAEQCISKHDCKQCRQVDRFGVGQSWYEFGSSSKQSNHQEFFKQGVKRWYDEVKTFNKNSVSKYSSGSGHFTQMIWAKSVYLGCGVVEYKDNKNWNKFLLICNYGPAGNVLMQPIYKEGKACSSCPAGSSCSKAFPGLCKK